MALSAFKVTHARARRLCLAPDMRRIAEGIAERAKADTPRKTGTMAGAYRVVQGDDPATYVVINETPYARYVEYGTRGEHAAAPLGRALAAAKGHR